MEVDITRFRVYKGWVQTLVILCGVLGNKYSGAKSSNWLVKYQDKVFLDPNLYQGPDRAHPLDNEHLYRQSMNG